MTDVRTVGANATVENIVAGKLHEFVSEASAIPIYMAAAAAGMHASVLIGGESFIQDQEISSANRFPIIPDDLLVEAAGLPGDRIIVSLRNSTAGGIAVQTIVDIAPV